MPLTISQLVMDDSNPLGNTEDVFNKRALHVKVGNSSLEPIPVSVYGSTMVTSVALCRITYGTTPVSTSAYVELIASLASSVSQVFIFDSSGRTLVIAVGAAGLEVDKLYVVPGGNGLVPIGIASGSRISIKAVSGNANVDGTEFNATFLG